jgi:hypothetical protein
MFLKYVVRPSSDKRQLIKYIRMSGNVPYERKEEGSSGRMSGNVPLDKKEDGMGEGKGKEEEPGLAGGHVDSAGGHVEYDEDIGLYNTTRPRDFFDGAMKGAGNILKGTLGGAAVMVCIVEYGVV